MKDKDKGNTSKEVNIGSIIDLSPEEFKKELINQKVTVGVALNLRLHLMNQYVRCKQMTQDLQSSILAGTLSENNSEVQKSYIGLFVQMQKIEDKVVCLSEYISQNIGS